MIVIFDVDGVLIDVSKSYHYSIRDTVKFFTGKDVSLEELRDIKFTFKINNDWDASIAGILYAKSGLLLEDFKDELKSFANSLDDFYKFATFYSIDLPDYNSLVEIFESFYEKHRDKEELIIPKEVLKQIKEKSNLTGIITGRPKRDLDYTFEKHGLYPFFDYIITEDDIPQPSLRKPSPYPLKLFFENNEYKEPVFYIGDTLADKQMVEEFNKSTGKNVQFILYENDHNKDIQTSLKAKSPEELLSILEGKR